MKGHDVQTYTHKPNTKEGPPWLVVREDTEELVRHEYTSERAAYVAEAMNAVAKIRGGESYTTQDLIHAAQLLVLDNLASEMMLDNDRVYVCSPDGMHWVDLEERMKPQAAQVQA